MVIVLSRFRETFFQEADEHISAMEAGLLVLAEGMGGTGLLNSILNGARFIKGAAATFGYPEVTKFSDALANLLDRMGAGEADITKARIALLLRAVEVLGGLLAAARNGSRSPASAATVHDLLIDGQRGSARDAAGPAETRPSEVLPASTEPVWRIHFAPGREAFRQGMDPVLAIRELSRLGRIVSNRIDATAVPALDRLDPENCHLCWNVRLETGATGAEIRSLFAFVEDGAALEIAREGEPGSAIQRFRRCNAISAS